MPKLVLFICLVVMSSQSYAAESWFDAALDFFGFGDEVEEPVGMIPAEPAKETVPSSDLAKVATNAAADAATASLTNMITSQLGVSDAQAKGGLGTLFGLAKSTLGNQDFQQLSGVVPGMDSLLAAAPTISDEAKGLTSLMGSAGKYGQALQGATAAYAQFKQLGIGVDQIPAYIDVTNGFLKSQGGDDVVTLFQKGVSALLIGEN
jgi:hypothetical protein